MSLIDVIILAISVLFILSMVLLCCFNKDNNCCSKNCFNCDYCNKTKERSENEYRNLINRLNRVEGQVRGIKRMVEANAYCADILIQVSAITAALNAFNKELLSEHIRTCVSEDIRAGKEETVDELVSVLQKLMK